MGTPAGGYLATSPTFDVHVTIDGLNINQKFGSEDELKSAIMTATYKRMAEIYVASKGGPFGEPVTVPFVPRRAAVIFGNVGGHPTIQASVVTMAMSLRDVPVLRDQTLTISASSLGGAIVAPSDGALIASEKQVKAGVKAIPDLMRGASEFGLDVVDGTAERAGKAFGSGVKGTVQGLGVEGNVFVLVAVGIIVWYLTNQNRVTVITGSEEK